MSAADLETTFWSGQPERALALIERRLGRPSAAWQQWFAWCQGRAAHPPAHSLESLGEADYDAWTRSALRWSRWAAFQPPPASRDPFLATGSGSRIVETLLLTSSQLEAGELSDAAQNARRAWRMARSESLPLLEISSALVLARVRRIMGSVSAARHVLAAVAPLAPPCLRDVLDWELTLCGAPVQGPGTPWACALRAIVAQGDLSTVSSLRAALRGSPPAERDLECVLGLLDLGSADPEAAAFARGEQLQLPRGTWALAERSDAPAWVLVAGSARRVLDRRLRFPGLPTELLGPDRVPQQRTAAALGLLSMQVGPPRRDTEFFAELYGFSFDARVHRAVFDTLLHRVREAGRGSLQVERSGGHLRVTPLRAFAVWDPRAAPMPENRLMAFLGSAGLAGAHEIADELGCSLRSAQLLLQRLVQDGVCRAETVGRAVRYALEDTSFSALTRARFVASGPGEASR